MNRDDILREFPLAVALLQAEEGFQATPYLCSQKKWTIGFGYNIMAHGHSYEEAKDWVWTREQALDALLDEVLDVVASLDTRFPKWRELLNADREAVAISACYQLGMGGAAAFHDTIAAIRRQDWDTAVACLLRSKWATQTRVRVKRNAEAMRAGKLPEVVNGVQIHHAENDGRVVQAQVQPAAPVLPAQGLRVDNPQSPLILPSLRDAAPDISVTNLLSKKLCVVIAGSLVLLLNQPLHFGMSPQDMSDLIKLLASYLIGQAGVDAFKPFAETLLKGGAK